VKEVKESVELEATGTRKGSEGVRAFRIIYILEMFVGGWRLGLIYRGGYIRITALVNDLSSQLCYNKLSWLIYNN
jgi:hypothetical protein